MSFRQKFWKQWRMHEFIIIDKMLEKEETRKEEEYFKLLIKICCSDLAKTLCSFYHLYFFI